MKKIDSTDQDLNCHWCIQIVDESNSFRNIILEKLKTSQVTLWNIVNEPPCIFKFIILKTWFNIFRAPFEIYNHLK